TAPWGSTTIGSAGYHRPSMTETSEGRASAQTPAAPVAPAASSAPASPAVPIPPIVFGTDGWRARIADEYTYENVRRCAQGVAEWVQQRGATEKGVIVGYDRRFSSEFFAQAAAEVLLAYDIPIAMANQPFPTQMTSYEVVERGAACGVMITASHNPWT